VHNAEYITLVLTDIGMPVMDGYELFCELKKLNPELPIIITSGFGDADATTQIPREDIAGMLSKPYNLDQLREVFKCAVEGVQKPT
jgi:FixJ family two-component response regulator